MDFEQKFLEELEKYKRKRSLSALADKAGVGQSDLSRALGKKGQKLKIDNLSKLLKIHMTDDLQIEKIIEFLCSESGSHDYTINRREAKNNLGLPIEKPCDKLYSLLKSVYVNFSEEMNLYEQFPPIPDESSQKEIDYNVVRAIIESADGGSDQFISKGVLVAQALQEMGHGNLVPIQFFNHPQSEGWKHVSSEQNDDR